MPNNTNTDLTAESQRELDRLVQLHDDLLAELERAKEMEAVVADLETSYYCKADLKRNFPNAEVVDISEAEFFIATYYKSAYFEPMKLLREDGLTYAQNTRFEIEVFKGDGVQQLDGRYYIPCKGEVPSHYLDFEHKSPFGKLAEIVSAGNPTPSNFGINLISLGDGLFNPYSWSYVYNVFGLHGVKKGEKDGEISYFKTHKDCLRGRRTEQRVTRAIRYMLPNLEQSGLDAWCQKYTDRFFKEDYTLHVGDSRKDFAKAYGYDLARSRNPATTSSRKSLHNSCMRGITVRGVSPAEVYASGDFKIAWLENADGQIAGRVVYAAEGNKDAGPIYGVCEHGIDLLTKHLESVGAKKFPQSSWLGLKILKIDAYGDIVGPYSDMECEAIDIGGGYLELCEEGEGDYSLTSTSGCMSECEGEYCENCENTTHDGLTYVPCDGRHVCDYCLEDDYTYTDRDGWVRNEDVIEVYYRSGGRTCVDTGELENQTYNVEVVYCECVSEYWDADDTVYSEKYEEYVPACRVDDFPEMFEQEEEEEGEAA